MPISRKWGIAVAFCAVAALASAASWREMLARPARDTAAAPRADGVAVPQQRAFTMVPTTRYPVIEQFNAGSGDIRTPAHAAKASQGNDRGTYLVLFNEAPLASYKGEVAGIPMSQAKIGQFGRPRLDVKSHVAREYVGYLQRKQQQMERQMSGLIRRPLQVRRRMQHAVNGIIADMTTAEAARIGAMNGVRLVEAYREYRMDTDVGPTLIGAPTV